MVLQANSTASSFVSGAISGACSTILFQPFDLIKIRMQAETMRSLANKSFSTWVFIVVARVRVRCSGYVHQDSFEVWNCGVVLRVALVSHVSSPTYL